MDLYFKIARCMSLEKSGAIEYEIKKVLMSLKTISPSEFQNVLNEYFMSWC